MPEARRRDGGVPLHRIAAQPGPPTMDAPPPPQLWVPVAVFAALVAGTYAKHCLFRPRSAPPVPETAGANVGVATDTTPLCAPGALWRSGLS